ncbi:glutamate decarboxylase [Mycobacteroides abscessus subsp. abscessus]|nr:glutamate decarboxylase [Mycobacteroides abscessus subsp. abscessus]
MREGFSGDLARALRDDLNTVLKGLDELKPNGHFDDNRRPSAEHRCDDRASGHRPRRHRAQRQVTA